MLVADGEIPQPAAAIDAFFDVSVFRILSRRVPAKEIRSRNGADVSACDFRFLSQ